MHEKSGAGIKWTKVWSSVLPNLLPKTSTPPKIFDFTAPPPQNFSPAHGKLQHIWTQTIERDIITYSIHWNGIGKYTYLRPHRIRKHIKYLNHTSIRVVLGRKHLELAVNQTPTIDVREKNYMGRAYAKFEMFLTYRSKTFYIFHPRLKSTRLPVEVYARASSKGIRDKIKH